jgi:6-phosphogluconolactonase
MADAENIFPDAPALLASRALILHFTGEEKLAVYRQCLEPNAAKPLPVGVVLHQSQVPVELWWSP